MKRLMALAAVMVLVLSFAAFAGEEKDFGAFKAYVPDGWTATQDGSTVAFTKDDNTSSVSITVEKTEGVSAKDLAAAFAEEFKKTFTGVTEPQVDEDGDYMFAFGIDDIFGDYYLTDFVMFNVEDGEAYYYPDF